VTAKVWDVLAADLSGEADPEVGEVIRREVMRTE
jgi:hypothetical protein